MIRKFAVALAAVVALNATPFTTTRSAEAQTLEQIQSVAAWAQQFQRIVSAFVVPLQSLPNPPFPGMSQAERRAWAASTREWAARAQASFNTARADLDRLPPSPPAQDAMTERLRSAIEAALPRLRESLDAGDRITSAYLTLADAVERNQMDRVNSIRVTAIEAALVSTRLFQDTNAAQAAAATPGNPQGPLAGAYGHSYGALYAILTYRLQLMRGETPDRAGTAQSISIAARQMREAVAQGRADLTLLDSQLNDPVIAASIDAALLPRLRALSRTFPVSFDREEQIAGDFESVARLLRGPDGGEATEMQIDVHLDAFSERDARRMDDIAQRNAIMTAQ